MADAYWRYAAADPRQQQQPPQQHSAAPVPGAHAGMGAASQMAAAAGVQQPMKRPRPADFSGSLSRHAPFGPSLLPRAHRSPRSDPRLVESSSALAAGGLPPLDLCLEELVRASMAGSYALTRLAGGWS
nr:unnamed protein product [Digitaria exilis]